MESFISLAIDKQKIKRTVECELIMSPLTLKAVHRFLGKQLEKYEATYGKLPSLEEVKSKSRKDKYEQSKGPDDLESFK
jgi:hypothetical protein